jgi:alpha-N-acetylglucosamine transferase
MLITKSVNMSVTFVSFLGTESFIPGIIALDQSIKLHNNKNNLLVLVTDNITNDGISVLHNYGIKTQFVAVIHNPYELGADERSYKYTFTKLSIFKLTEFKKIVYIDADMLVCTCIEELFDKPHMSAVAAGSLHPSNQSWKDLNSGLLVIEPDKKVFEQLASAIGKLPSEDGSDQGFLHEFFKEWKSDQTLHLHHKYNVPYSYLNEYCELPDFEFKYKKRLLESNISLIHYWGKYKPWNFNIRSLKRRSGDKPEQSLILWWDTLLNAKDH